VGAYLKEHKGGSLHRKTIYQLIYADKASGGDLYLHLRIASKPYRKRYGSYDRRGKIKNRVVSKRAQPLWIDATGSVTAKVTPSLARVEKVLC
jgi:IS30 family transposase